MTRKLGQKPQMRERKTGQKQIFRVERNRFSFRFEQRKLTTTLPNEQLRTVRVYIHFYRVFTR